jgi:hypothetical protein
MTPAKNTTKLYTAKIVTKYSRSGGTVTAKGNISYEKDGQLKGKDATAKATGYGYDKTGHAVDKLINDNPELKNAFKKSIEKAGKGEIDGSHAGSLERSINKLLKQGYKAEVHHIDTDTHLIKISKSKGKKR